MLVYLYTYRNGAQLNELSFVRNAFIYFGGGAARLGLLGRFFTTFHAHPNKKRPAGLGYQRLIALSTLRRRGSKTLFELITGIVISIGHTMSCLPSTRPPQSEQNVWCSSQRCTHVGHCSRHTKKKNSCYIRIAPPSTTQQRSKASTHVHDRFAE